MFIWIMLTSQISQSLTRHTFLGGVRGWGCGSRYRESVERVDLVLAGHMHAYERVHPVHNGTVVAMPAGRVDGCDVYRHPPAPPHITVGSAGAAQDEKWVAPAPAWSAVALAGGRMRGANASTPGQYLDSFGYTRARAFNSTHMQLQFIPIRGELSDCFWITREH